MFEEKEKHATLIFDEMAIKRGLQYDNTLSIVIGAPSVKQSNGKQNSNELATHGVYVRRSFYEMEADRGIRLYREVVLCSGCI